MRHLVKRTSDLEGWADSRFGLACRNQYVQGAAAIKARMKLLVFFKICTEAAQAKKVQRVGLRGLVIFAGVGNGVCPALSRACWEKEPSSMDAPVAPEAQTEQALMLLAGAKRV